MKSCVCALHTTYGTFQPSGTTFQVSITTAVAYSDERSTGRLEWDLLSNDVRLPAGTGPLPHQTRCLTVAQPQKCLMRQVFSNSGPGYKADVTLKTAVLGN